MRTFLPYTQEVKVVKNPKYEVLKDRKNNYFFQLRARTGDIIITSKAYEGKNECMKRLSALREEADFDFQEFHDKQRKLYYFNVVNHNEELIAHSENYTTKIGRGNGIMSVMRIVCDAPVQDMTVR